MTKGEMRFDWKPISTPLWR